MSLALEVKSLTGTGIFLQINSQITSMLYLSCAEIGTTGAPSAIVPIDKINFKKMSTRVLNSTQVTVSIIRSVSSVNNVSSVCN